MITTHQLAGMLLGRRDHTLRVDVLVDDDPDGNREMIEHRATLRDADKGCSWGVDSNELLYYDSEHDVLVLRVGPIVIGDDAP